LGLLPEQAQMVLVPCDLCGATLPFKEHCGLLALPGTQRAPATRKPVVAPAPVRLFTFGAQSPRRCAAGAAQRPKRSGRFVSVRRARLTTPAAAQGSRACRRHAAPRVAPGSGAGGAGDGERRVRRGGRGRPGRRGPAQRRLRRGALRRLHRAARGRRARTPLARGCPQSLRLLARYAMHGSARSPLTGGRRLTPGSTRAPRSRAGSRSVRRAALRRAAARRPAARRPRRARSPTCRAAAGAASRGRVRRPLRGRSHSPSLDTLAGGQG